MGKMRIHLDTNSEAIRLAQIAEGLGKDYTITVTDGNGLRVNAKSVMGMLYVLEFEDLWLESNKDVYMKFQDFAVIE